MGPRFDKFNEHRLRAGNRLLICIWKGCYFQNHNAHNIIPKERRKPKILTTKNQIFPWKICDNSCCRKMKNNTQFSNVGYGPSSNAAKSRQKVNKLVLIIVYLFAFLGFTFVAVSQATTSWTIVDNYKDFVYPDEYQGLWQKCYDKQAYECVPRKSLSKYFGRSSVRFCFLWI